MLISAFINTLVKSKCVFDNFICTKITKTETKMYKNYIDKNSN